MVRHRASVGLAFDGDADRVIAVDERGDLVDGDRLLALFALDLQSRGRLLGSTVVVTVMTNLGFHQKMSSAGIAVHQTPVGDRHVLAALESGGWSLGGEQSGHLIFRRHATTGDGVMTGLLLMDLLVRTGGSLHDMAAAAMVRLPQVILNVSARGPFRPRRRHRGVGRGGGSGARSRGPREGPSPGERHRADDPGDGRGADRGGGR